MDKKINFRKQLDPNNPIYAQPKKKIDLTPEQLTHRKEILNGHFITNGERMHKEVNEYISEHPNAVAFIKISILKFYR